MAHDAFITDAAAEAGTYRKMGARWLMACGGVRPRRGRNLKGQCLTFAEREEIALCRAKRHGVREIALSLGRSPSTISRELRRNRDRRGQYRASSAHTAAYERASRPKDSKLAMQQRLRERVETDLKRKYPPEQITGRLRADFPDDPSMQVAHETIYQALYVQSRGVLKRDLSGVCAPGGRCASRPERPGSARTGSPT